jgi:hypothetical protein
MDELTLLRELDADPPALTDPARRAARLRLDREVARGERRPSRPDRRRVGGLVAAVAVAGLAGFIAIGGRDASDSSRPPVRLASAAPVLYGAALQARKEPSLRYRGDQYLYTREIMEEIPVDGSGETLTFVNEYWRSADGSRPSRVIERGRTWTEPPIASDAVWPPRDLATLEELPADPDELVRTSWFSHDSSDSVVYDTRYMLLGMLLTRELPPDLRGAAFEALARIPDVVIVGAVEAGGRRAIGVSRPTDPGFSDRVLLFAPKTYEYIGMREPSTRDDGTEIYRVIAQEASGVVDSVGERPDKD